MLLLPWPFQAQCNQLVICTSVTCRGMKHDWTDETKGAVTATCLVKQLVSELVSHNVKKNNFSITLQGMLHQAICSMQLAMIIIKNSIKTASANVWRHIVSQKSIGSHPVYKHCETSCKRDVTLCNALKMRCSVAAIVAKSRTWFYFVQWLLQQ